ncbi:MAG: hypothetical protein NT040_13295 [Bacteroidetes bacterium]|nr:hypothetical protein [Bacteroidota bacterium]
MKKIAIVVILAGLVLTIFTAFTFFTREKIVDLGSVEITRSKPHNINWSPLIGVAVMALGGVLLWESARK